MACRPLPHFAKLWSSQSSLGHKGFTKELLKRNASRNMRVQLGSAQSSSGSSGNTVVVEWIDFFLDTATPEQQDSPGSFVLVAAECEGNPCLPFEDIAKKVREGPDAGSEKVGLLWSKAEVRGCMIHATFEGQTLDSWPDGKIIPMFVPEKETAEINYYLSPDSFTTAQDKISDIFGSHGGSTWVYNFGPIWRVETDGTVDYAIYDLGDCWCISFQGSYTRDHYFMSTEVSECLSLIQGVTGQLMGGC